MSFVKKFGAIYRTDLKLLRRDPMLLYSATMVFILLLIVHYSKDRIGAYYPLLALLMLIFILMIFGMIPGFMMAEEKENRTIQALQVVPISSEAFLVYRLTWASLITLALTAVAPYILDLEIPQKGLLTLMTLFFLVVVWRNLSTDWSKFAAFLLTYWLYKVFEGIPFNDHSDFPVAVMVHLAWLIPLVVLFKRRVF